MKTVKYIISVLVILFCFALSSELYQSHLHTFSNQFYFIDIDTDDREVVCSAVLSAVEKYNEDVFAVERKDIDAFHSKVLIYATEDMQKELITEQNVIEGEARSFFSGTTEVVYCSFGEVVNNEDVIRYYFTGSKNDVSSIRQYINSRLATSYIHKETITGNENLIYVVWILCFGFILLLTWLDIQYSRKSDFLKISMGSSVCKIIFTNMLKDIVLNISIVSAVYLILRDKIFVSYKLSFVLVVFLLFSIINSLLYATLAKSNYKEIIYGANINGKLLANTYLLKAMIMIMLVITLACNFTTINENAEGLRPYSRLNKVEGYNTLSVTPTSEILADEESTNRFRTRLFMEAYAQNKVLLATSCAALDEEPIVVVNDAALKTVVSDPEQLQNTTEMFGVYIPEEKAGEISDYDIEFALRTTATNFFGLEDYSFEVVNYTHTEVIYFDLRGVSELPLGFEMLSDPIIVVCNISEEQIKVLMDQNPYVEFRDRWANIIFDVQDTSVFSDEVEKNIEDIFYNSVIDQCSQHKNSLLRSVLLNSILCVFLLILSILLISVIVKMEYLINSKEIALKKIMGYSIIRRNMGMILLNVFAVFIAFVTGLIISHMYNIFGSITLCIVCLFVFLIDTILILSNMAVAENKNTAHILKGGSL